MKHFETIEEIHRDLNDTSVAMLCSEPYKALPPEAEEHFNMAYHSIQIAITQLNLANYARMKRR